MRIVLQWAQMSRIWCIQVCALSLGSYGCKWHADTSKGSAVLASVSQEQPQPEVGSPVTLSHTPLKFLQPKCYGCTAEHQPCSALHWQWCAVWVCWALRVAAYWIAAHTYMHSIFPFITSQHVKPNIYDRPYSQHWWLEKAHRQCSAGHNVPICEDLSCQMNIETTKVIAGMHMTYMMRTCQVHIPLALLYVLVLDFSVATENWMFEIAFQSFSLSVDNVCL